MTRKIIDPITAPPIIIGAHGRAWLCDLAAFRERQSIPADQFAMLCHYLIEAPWAHPAWHSYCISLVHLRPLSDNDTPIIYLDGATHEFILSALNPERDRNALLLGKVGDHFLSPLNFAAQFIAASDAAAIERIRETVGDIVNGTLSPDTDFRSLWIARFGDAMMKW
jgi:hypothetical protein